jgi:hypothetical protein
MTLIDSILKWFKAPKTLYGIAGMIVIIIVLALDFAYWAGAIEVGSTTNGSNEGNGDNASVIPDNYEETFSGTLEHGRKLYSFQQLTNDPRGEGEGETYNLYTFPIDWNTSELQITSDGDGGRPRVDGGDSNDIDLYLYAPGKEAGGNFESTDPDYEGASPYIQEGISQDNLEIGNWTLRVDCYTGNGVEYMIEIKIFYPQGNVTEDGD